MNWIFELKSSGFTVLYIKLTLFTYKKTINKLKNNKFKMDNLLVKALIKAIRKRRINEIVIIIAVILILY